MAELSISIDTFCQRKRRPCLWPVSSLLSTTLAGPHPSSWSRAILGDRQPIRGLPPGNVCTTTCSRRPFRVLPINSLVRLKSIAMLEMVRIDVNTDAYSSCRFRSGPFAACGALAQVVSWPRHSACVPSPTRSHYHTTCPTFILWCYFSSPCPVSRSPCVCFADHGGGANEKHAAAEERKSGSPVTSMTICARRRSSAAF